LNEEQFRVISEIFLVKGKRTINFKRNTVIEIQKIIYNLKNILETKTIRKIIPFEKLKASIEQVIK
jgi:hypothetical protein